MNFPALKVALIEGYGQVPYSLSSLCDVLHPVCNNHIPNNKQWN